MKTKKLTLPEILGGGSAAVVTWIRHRGDMAKSLTPI
jgi:hypothetical protein